MQPFMTMQPCKTTEKQRGFAMLYFIHLHIVKLWGKKKVSYSKMNELFILCLWPKVREIGHDSKTCTERLDGLKPSSET